MGLYIGALLPENRRLAYTYIGPSESGKSPYIMNRYYPKLTEVSYMFISLLSFMLNLRDGLI